MGRFLRLVAGEPDISRVPMMIDSSRFDVIREGLVQCPGPLSGEFHQSEEGEAAFLEQARGPATGRWW